MGKEPFSGMPEHRKLAHSTRKDCGAKGGILSSETMGDEVETGQKKQSQGIVSWNTGRWQGEPAAGQMVRPMGARLQRQKVWGQQAWII